MSPQNHLNTYGIHLPYVKIFSLFFLLLINTNLFAQQLAFPTAEGAGAYVTGGRGGIVVKVTNLNNSGPGSLRNALLMTVPRTIIFDVSGIINLTSIIEIPYASSNFTVAGQTAPQGGITIAGKPIQMGGGPNNQNCNNAIWRYIRFRNGSYTGVSDVYDHNGFISVGTNGLIIDHCSFSFCDDQAISMDSYYGDLTNITIQRCIFSENTTGIITGLQGTNPRGNITIAKNLYADQTHRTPNMGGNLQWDLINNVYFNYGNRLANANSGSPKINNIGNYHKPGSYTSGRNNVVQNVIPTIYSANNYHPNLYPIPQLNDNLLWTNFNVFNQPLPSNYFSSNMFPILGNIEILSANDTYLDVTNDVGANRYLNADGTFGVYQDSFDIIKTSNVLNNISSNPANKNWSQPAIPFNIRNANYDTDNDGMPDVWEIANGLDINNPNDRNNLQPDGYTNLEYFLNGLSLNTETITANAGQDTAICQGESVTLTASGGSSYLWSTGATTSSITVNPNTTTTYSVTAFSASGNSSDTDEVIVTVNTQPIANAGDDVETCFGTAVTLTASGGSTYLWNTGATTAGITVNPSTTTTYSVEVTQNGCSSTDQVIVTVNQLPTINAGNDVTIFEGESVTLSASGGTSYIWSNGATTQNITVSPTETTTYTVTGSANGCLNTDSVTVFLVDDGVTVNAGNDETICQGESVTLTATGGSTYLWSTGATTASIIVDPNTTTTYTVTAYSASGNNSDTDEVIVTVNTPPTANAGDDVSTCPGTPVTLTASGGSSYLWSNGATTPSINVNPNTTTTYSVEVTQNGCSSTDQLIVTVNSLPNINAGNDITIFSGESVTLSASGGTSYVWSTGETTQSVNVSPTVTTTYTVTGSANGCEDADEVTVFVQTDDVDANAGNDETICQGESITLTATGGTTYEWSTGATTSSITVNPTTTTTYSVTAYSISGNNSDTDEVIVTVNTPPTANAGNDVSTCQGTAVTLTASGGSSYLWSNGATTQSINVNPNTTTTYSVEVTQNGCSSTDEVIVTVNSLPTINAGNNVTILEGESVTLSASGGSSYVWNTGATTQNITVSPTATTTYTVTGSANGCQNTDSVTVFVNVETVTAEAGENETICQGYSTTLTATGGDTYLWNTGATTQSITVNPNATSTYTVTVFAGNAQDSDDVTVFVNPNPNVIITNGDEVTILEGEFITLSATGANTYLWNNGATQPNIAVSPTNTTTFSVTGFINNCEDEKDVLVNVLERVNAEIQGEQSVCLNESIVLTAVENSNAEYLWNTGETTQSITVTPTEDTEYSVTVFNALDYDTAEVMVIVNDCSVIIPEEPETFEFLVYPNPTSGVLNIKINGLINVADIYLYDVSGKSLYYEKINEDEQQSYIKQLNVSNFASGVYFLKLVDNTTVITKKIIVN